MSGADRSRRTEIQVKFNNVDISRDLNEHLISLSYADNSAEATDDLKIKINDREGKWIRQWLTREKELGKEENQAAEETAEAGSGQTAYTVTAKIGLNVRSGKGTGYSKLGALPYGQSITVTEISDGWATITYSGKTAYVSAQYITQATGNTGNSGSGGSGTWSIGDQVTVTGTPQYSSYGLGRPGNPVTNHTGRITYLNLRDGVQYPICVDALGWFAISDVTGGPEEGVDGSDGNTAKYTKIDAVIKAVNVDGNGKDLTMDCGSFELDNVDTSGPPQVVELSAGSVRFESGMRKTKKSRTWTKTTLSGIAGEIAAGGGYELQYLSSFDPTFESIEQDEKTDLEFLWEHCKKYALKLKVTAGKLVVYDSAEQDAQPPVRTLKFGDGTYSSYKLNSALHDGYSSCHVSYEDDQGNTFEATFAPATAYTEGEVLEITEQVDSNAMAEELARRRLRQENKKEMTGSFTMPGDPNLMAGVNVEIEGWGDFDGKYSVESTKHEVGSGGYRTSIEIQRIITEY